MAWTQRGTAQAILILIAVDSEELIRDCLEAGVRGWVFESDGTADLTTAVEAGSGARASSVHEWLI